MCTWGSGGEKTDHKYSNAYNLNWTSHPVENKIVTFSEDIIYIPEYRKKDKTK